MKAYSLESELSKKVLLLNSFIFVVLVAAINIIVSNWLVHELDEELESKANLLISLVKITSLGFSFDFSDEFLPEFGDSEEPEFFQIWLNNGSVFEKSASLNNKDLPREKFNESTALMKDLRLINGRNGRLIQVDFRPKKLNESQFSGTSDDRNLMTLVLAYEREELDLLISTIRFSSITITIVILIIINFVVKHTVRKSLSPLSDIKNQISSLDADNLNQRLNTVNSPTELIGVIKQFNHLLVRLDESFYREQRFSSDVAHELRTPIAEIRTMSEVALKWPDDNKLVTESYAGIIESCIQMQGLVNNLLALTGYEKGNVKLDCKKLHLLGSISDCIQHYIDVAAIKNIRIKLNIIENIFVLTSQIEFEQVLNNIISNAIEYSPENTEIIIASQVVEKHVKLIISNTTNQLEKDDLALMFDRLWRKSKARSSGEHSGLGLSLVKAYIELLNLDLETKLNQNIFSLTIRGLPLSA